MSICPNSVSAHASRPHVGGNLDPRTQRHKGSAVIAKAAPCTLPAFPSASKNRERIKWIERERYAMGVADISRVELPRSTLCESPGSLKSAAVHMPSGVPRRASMLWSSGAASRMYRHPSNGVSKVVCLWAARSRDLRGKWEWVTSHECRRTDSIHPPRCNAQVSSHTV